MIFRILILFAISFALHADETTIYQTFKHTDIPNYGKPKAVVDDKGTVYETFGNTDVPNYAKPIGKMESTYQDNDD